GRRRRRNAGAARAAAADSNVSVTTMPVSWTTAEWVCTRCGSTNRKLVPAGARRAADECVTCHTRHELEPDERPVRWRARPLGRGGAAGGGGFPRPTPGGGGRAALR